MTRRSLAVVVVTFLAGCCRRLITRASGTPAPFLPGAQPPASTTVYVNVTPRLGAPRAVVEPMVASPMHGPRRYDSYQQDFADQLEQCRRLIESGPADLTGLLTQLADLSDRTPVTATVWPCAHLGHLDGPDGDCFYCGPHQ